MNKSFVEMSAAAEKENFKKPLAQGMQYYSDLIVSALSPINVMDIPLIVATLDTIAGDLKELYPDCIEFSKNIQKSMKREITIIEIGGGNCEHEKSK